MYSLFEITLSAIDSKLRRVDGLERSMELLAAKVADSSARTDAVLAKLTQLDGRINRLASVASGAAAAAAAGPALAAEAYSLEPRILALDEKVSEIGSKLNVLAYQLDSNSLPWPGLGPGAGNETSREEFSASGSEQSRTYATPPAKTARDDGAELKSTMASVDRHLKILVELFSEQMDKMMGAVAEVRAAVDAPEATRCPGQADKLEQAYEKMAPLLDVSDRVDRVWNVLLGAKSSIDSLAPTSEALLWQTQRHERALADMHAEVSVKTKQIIDQLGQLVPAERASPSTKRFKNTEALDSASNKAQESQHIITFKQTASEQPQSRTVPSSIRVQELSPGPVVSAVLTAAKSTVTTTQATTTTTSTTTPLPPLPEVVPIPSDIMDSEFLHDEPVPSANLTASTNTSSIKKADLADKTLSTTSRSVSQSAVPAGPTERSRVPSNSAVIFPSVKNKPGFTNSTFFYENTAPQNIRVSFNFFPARQMALCASSRNPRQMSSGASRSLTNAFFATTGLLVRRAEGAGPDKVRHLLSAHPRHDVLVHQGLLRHGDGERRLDGEWTDERAHRAGRGSATGLFFSRASGRKSRPTTAATTGDPSRGDDGGHGASLFGGRFGRAARPSAALHPSVGRARAQVAVKVRPLSDEIETVVIGRTASGDSRAPRESSVGGQHDGSLSHGPR